MGRLMKRRVVITGIGAVSPNGIGTEPFWASTRDGISGIGPITRFDCKDFGVRYTCHRNAFAAIASHYRWLREMGRFNDVAA